MKIELPQENGMYFSELSVGWTFWYKGDIYVKTQEYHCRYGGQVLNAVNLTDNRIHYFDSYVIVSVVACKMVPA